jgi:signal transduction histidine kinase
VLGVLLAGVGEEPGRPQPGVAELDALVARVRSAGLPVRYECTGIAAELPSGVQLAVFRLVQEALTNTMKHAGPRASAAVRLQVSSGEVSVDIEDDGAGGMTKAGAAGGGLTGMRERIRAFGGELDCGPRDPQGWRVSARIRPDAAAVS